MRFPKPRVLIAACALASVPAWPQSLSGTPAKAAKAPLVAVMPLRCQGIDENSSAIVTDALGTEILRTGAYRVMERSQMDRILKEQGFQQSGVCDGAECAVEMGKLLAIDRMVVGSVGKLGSSWTVSARLVDVATGEVMGSAMRMKQGDIEVVATDLLPPLVRDLVFGTRSAPAAPAPVAAPPSPAPVAPQPVVAAVPVAQPLPVARATPREEIDDRPEIDPRTGWKRRVFRVGLGGTFSYISPNWNGDISSNTTYSGTPGPGFHVDVNGLFTIANRVELGVGLGYGLETFGEEYEGYSSSGTSSSYSSYKVSYVLADGEFDLYAGWKILPKLSVGTELLFRVPLFGSADVTSDDGGTTDSRSVDLVPAPSSLSDIQDDEAAVETIPYLGLRVGWQPAYRLRLDGAVRVSLTGLYAGYDADGQRTSATRTNNLNFTEIAFGVHFLF